MKEYAFGIDLGGTTAKIGLFKTTGELLEKWEVPTDTSNAGEHILENLAAAVQGKMQEKGLAAEQVEGVATSFPSLVSHLSLLAHCSCFLSARHVVFESHIAILIFYWSLSVSSPLYEV